MKALIQRVSEASVTVDGRVVGEIGRGLLVFLGMDKHDDRFLAERLMEKILHYRVFPDEGGRMNCSVSDITGGILLVSQFTLSADTRKGLRPSFSAAASSVEAEALYCYSLEVLRSRYSGAVEAGVFGADMQVSLVNDGPVTFLLGS